LAVWRKCRHRVDEAIADFNAANTDSDFTAEQTEAVQMVGAFAPLGS
jgi:hypothetical protein